MPSCSIRYHFCPLQICSPQLQERSSQNKLDQAVPLQQNPSDGVPWLLKVRLGILAHKARGELVPSSLIHPHPASCSSLSLIVLQPNLTAQFVSQVKIFLAFKQVVPSARNVLLQHPLQNLAPSHLSALSPPREIYLGHPIGTPLPIIIYFLHGTNL